MQGVAGGVSNSPGLEAGQALVTNPDLLSASTTLQQSGGGGYARLVDALQSLDQAGNIAALLQGLEAFTAQLTAINTHLASIDAQITSINGQIGTLNTQMSQVQTALVTQSGQIGALQAQLDGVAFGAVGAAPTVLAGSLATTVGGTQYLLPLYSS